MSEPSSREALRHRLRQALTNSGLTQAELADRCDAATGTVSDWFNPGKDAIPDGEKMARLPRALGVSGHWLLTGEGPTVAGGTGSVERAENAGARRILSYFAGLIDELRRELEGDADAPTRRAARALAQERRDADTARSSPGRRRGARRRAS